MIEPLGIEPLNAHHSPWILPFVGLQIVMWFFVLAFTAERPGLTVRLHCLGRLAGPFHRLCRLIACLAYVACIFGAAGSGLAIAGEMAGATSWALSAAQNDLSVAVSRCAGGVVAWHIAGALWLLARREAEAEACREEEQAEAEDDDPP